MEEGPNGREWQVHCAISGATGGTKYQYGLAFQAQVGVKPRGAFAKGPNRYLATRSIESPATYPSSTRRTAGCGPACPVVWEGRPGDRPPYPDSAEVAGARL